MTEDALVIRTGAWHATCGWTGTRYLALLYTRGTLPVQERRLLHDYAFRLPRGA